MHVHCRSDLRRAASFVRQLPVTDAECRQEQIGATQKFGAVVMARQMWRELGEEGILGRVESLPACSVEEFAGARWMLEDARIRGAEYEDAMRARRRRAL